MYRTIMYRTGMEPDVWNLMYVYDVTILEGVSANDIVKY